MTRRLFISWGKTVQTSGATSVVPLIWLLKKVIVRNLLATS
jgi:hypothetical protein